MWKSMGQLLPALLRTESDTWSFGSVRPRMSEAAEGLSEHCSWSLSSLSQEQVPRLACIVVTKVGIKPGIKQKRMEGGHCHTRFWSTLFLRLWKKLWKKPISFLFCVVNDGSEPSNLLETFRNHAEPFSRQGFAQLLFADHLQLIRKMSWEAVS